MEQSATVQLLSSAGHPVSDLHRQTLPATGNLLAYAGGGGYLSAAAEFGVKVKTSEQLRDGLRSERRRWDVPAEKHGVQVKLQVWTGGAG